MQTIIIVVHVIVAIVIIGLVLLQHGKGADAGASFGAGASQTVFGASGSGSFLVQATTIAATIFFVTSLSLAIFAKSQAGVGST
ncbi:MAG: preprotein translocase subunit SecG, partial [Gammaproteobacteria bacterium]|nr:preprotein translocase subunit SecG [Gammaproteobacteria bacterium]